MEDIKVQGYRDDFLTFGSDSDDSVQEKEKIIMFDREFYFWSGLSDSGWLFTMCRKKFMELSSMATDTSNQIPASYEEVNHLASKIKAEISAFMSYLDHCFKICLENCVRAELLVGEFEFLEANLNNFRNLFSNYFIFHCSKQLLPLQLQSHFHLPNVDYFWLHCHLDVRRAFIQIRESSKKIKTRIKFSGSDSKTLKNLFNDSEDSIISVMISEMVLLAIINCQTVEKDNISKGIFPCNCVKELWKVLLCLNQEIFWKCFKQILGALIEHKIPSTNEKVKNIFIPIYQHVKDVTEILCNLFVNVAECSNRIHPNNYSTGKPYWMKEENFMYLLVKNFLKVTPSEGSLRSLMRFIIPVMDWLESREELLMFLWEFFHKRFNYTFLLHNEIFNPRMIERMTAREILEEARNRFKLQEMPNETENSLSIFIRMIGHHLFQCRTMTRPRARMFGRIYVKFQTSRKFLVLSELGIYHMTILFLTMAFALDIEKQAERYYDILKLAPTEQLIPCKRRIVCKSIAAYILLLDEHDLDIEDFTMLLLREVQYAISTRDDDDIAILVECVKSLLKTRNSKISLFIGSWIDIYLKIFGDSVIDTIVGAFQPLIIQIRRGMEGWTEEVILSIKQKVYNYFIPLLEKYIFLSTSDFAAGLVSLLMRDPGKSNELFSFFRLWINCKEDIIFHKFLGALIEDEDFSLLNKFFCGYGVFFVKRVIRSHFVSGAIIEPDLFVKILKFVPELDMYSSSYAHDWWGENDIVVSFIRLFGKISNEMSTDRKHVSKLYSSFFDLDEWLNVALKNLKDESVVENLFHYTSLMVKECCYFMYDRYDDRCLLSKIMKRLVLPWEAYHSKHRISKVANDALQRYLHNYIDGICKIASSEDIYLRGVVRDLIRCYFPKSANCAFGDLKTHPLHKSLSKLENSEYLIDIIKNLYFNTKSYSHSDAEDCLLFLTTVQGHDVRDKIFDSCIGNILDLLLDSKLRSRGESLSMNYINFDLNRSNFCRRSMVRCLGSFLERMGKYDKTIFLKVMKKLESICPQELSFLKYKIQHMPED